jgi:hypothetical protein
VAERRLASRRWMNGATTKFANGLCVKADCTLGGGEGRKGAGGSV